ncbi:MULTISPECIES: lanthionine synthetase LanC family protein [Clostridium]|uniref:lanthionine synthetase LanC family protein n=1 Tax=Clostridium TaxID=1485 RepID=UPI0008254881|nr:MULTISPECIES: lanthionine synthetase LanC family protein [Clostridium]PJI08300.1 hypothetical protein CUB90_10685 [Clostridium sp. CT7]
MELKNGNFIEEIIDKNNFRKQLAFILKIKSIVKDNYLVIKNKLLTTDEKLKVKEIKYYMKEERAIITFTNNKKIAVQTYVSEDEKIINRFIWWINEKVDEKHALYVKKAVYSKDYSFCELVESMDCKNENELFDYYFKSGELLLVLYILKCKEIRSSNIVDVRNYPILDRIKKVFYFNNEVPNFNFSSANQIAERVIKFSVYNIEFLPKSKSNIDRECIYQIKHGFEYMYSLVMNNKMELINLIKKLFNKNILQLSNIITSIYGMNNEDLRRQLYFIDIRFIGKTIPKTYVKFSSDKNENSINESELLSLANDFGEHMIQKGIIGVKDFTTSRTWINTVKKDKSEKYLLRPLRNNLMNGSGGVALFFTYLGVVTKKDYFISIAIEAIQGILEHINKLCINDKINIDAFEGISGEIYAMYKLYEVTHDEHIRNVIEKGIEILSDVIQKNNNKNTITGMCDVINVLALIYKSKGLSRINGDILNLIKICYEKVINDIKNENIKFSIIYDSIIISIVKIYEISKDDSLLNVIQGILSTQRSLKKQIYIYDNLKWRKREFNKIISRVMLRKIGFKDKYIKREIDSTIDYIINNNFRNSPYYYGSLGSLEALKYAAYTLNDEKLKNRCVNTFNEMFRVTIEPIIRKEINFGNENISLIDGVVGLAYSLIRIEHEEIVPEILTLE